MGFACEILNVFVSVSEFLLFNFYQAWFFPQKCFSNIKTIWRTLKINPTYEKNPLIIVEKRAMTLSSYLSQFWTSLLCLSFKITSDNRNNMLCATFIEMHFKLIHQKKMIRIFCFFFILKLTDNAAKKHRTLKLLKLRLKFCLITKRKLTLCKLQSHSNRV